MRHFCNSSNHKMLLSVLVSSIWMAILATGCASTELKYQILMDRDFAVEPMLETGVFRTGDRFRLRIEPKQDCHVYVLSRGTSGRFTVLFPLKQIYDGANLIAAGADVTVPPTGSYQFDGRQGNEELVVCVSVLPHPELEQLARDGFSDSSAVESLLVRLEQANRSGSSYVKTLDKNRTRVCLVANDPEAILVCRTSLKHEAIDRQSPLQAGLSVDSRSEMPRVDRQPPVNPSTPAVTQAETGSQPPTTGSQSPPAEVEQPLAPTVNTNPVPSSPQAVPAQVSPENAGSSALTLTEAVRQGLIKVEPTGQNLSTVRLSIRRLRPSARPVEVPAGTYFVNRGSSQNMISTQVTSINLDSEKIEIDLPAACADFNRPEPSSHSRFKLGRIPNESLRRLMEVIGKQEVKQQVAQAAIWVVTNNISRAELDQTYRATRYVNGSNMGSGPAVSNEDIAAARQLLDSVGFNTARARLFR